MLSSPRLSSWMPMGTILAANNLFLFTDTNPISLCRFYRTLADRESCGTSFPCHRAITPQAKCFHLNTKPICHETSSSSIGRQFYEIPDDFNRLRSEERRVGKECR